MAARSLTVAVLVLAILAVVTPAAADGPFGVELGVKLGGGTRLGELSPSPLHYPALGGRLGMRYDRWYGGLSVTGYPGESVAIAGGSMSAHAMLYGLEAGYGLTFAQRFTLRAQVGFGDADIESASTSASYFYLEPGVLAMARLDYFFVGLDANALMVPAGPPNRSHGRTVLDAAFTSHLQAGVTF